MNNNTSLKIVIAETSVIIRSGLTAVLKRIPNLNAHPIEVSSPESLQNYIHMHPADIIIINPTFGGWFDLPAFKAEHGKSGIKYIAMVCSVIDNNILKEYDENFAMCDDIDVITSKINHLLHTEEEEEKDSEQETLRHRQLLPEWRDECQGGRPRRRRQLCGKRTGGAHRPDAQR